jgi:hypothetical protein
MVQRHATARPPAVYQTLHRVEPSASPSMGPSGIPTLVPSAGPSALPSSEPSSSPGSRTCASPNLSPTGSRSSVLSLEPTLEGEMAPSKAPVHPQAQAVLPQWVRMLLLAVDQNCRAEFVPELFTERCQPQQGTKQRTFCCSELDAYQ